MIPILSFLVIVAGIWIFAWYRTRNINKENTDGYFFSGRSLGGLVIAGTSPDNRLVEVVEIANHPWFVASQFHPELKSRPNHPHPLFAGFVRAALAVVPK